MGGKNTAIPSLIPNQTFKAQYGEPHRGCLVIEFNQPSQEWLANICHQVFQGSCLIDSAFGSLVSSHLD